MLIRISLILAIVAGLAVGVLNLVIVRDKITALQTDLANTKDTLAKTQADLASTKSKLAKTETDLADTKKTLEATTAERDNAVKEAATQSKRATQLAEELKKTKDERDTAQQELAAYRATGFTPEQVLTLGRTLKQTQDTLAGVQQENVVLGRKMVKLQNDLAIYRDPQYVVTLPANLKGKILVSDPKWDFVVLDVGQDQGVLEHGELLVNRDGKLVAKIAALPTSCRAGNWAK
jgi:uncharacterized membrane-anchored protein YhcB (DUF1043 family)